ncbi:unnamed protein product [Nippostrongylus brasiliensis]|uniref:Location of vulva defective 1 (inferred by orthology to a C. elegans protein) n=1 Tax=Nippostrongylus brasiliensis TaxID=27835 RepID=A0A158R2K5_NIPBR|nr:unnamed protein product [Nippostrongylus brasiliensis]
MVFMYTGTLFLINIFIMIILFEFERVRNDSSRQTNEYELLDHIQTKISRSVGLYSRQNLPACYVQDTLKDAKLLNALEAKADLLLHRVYKWHDEDDRNYRIVPERVQDISDHEFGWNF